MSIVQCGELTMDNKTQSHRLFYALWPDHTTRDALLNLQMRVLGRKTAFDNLHLTLAFLGQQPAELLPGLKTILIELPSTPITMVFNRIGYFTKNKIVWAGMHDTPAALIALQRNLMESLAQHNIAFNGQSEFRPHITLARDAPQPEDLPFPPIAWQAGQVALVESVNQPASVSYRVLASHPLRADPRYIAG
jgi:2'-5' RNA ligase